MTGKGHRICTFMIVLAATGSWLASAAATVGSTFPDSVEKLIWGSRSNRHHRRSSHWFAPYLAIFLLVLFAWDGRSFLDSTLPKAPHGVRVCIAFWFMGGLLHIAEDAFCGKVPLLNPRKKTFGWKFFEMSPSRGRISTGEAIFTGFVVLSCLCTWLQRFVFRSAGPVL